MSILNKCKQIVLFEYQKYQTRYYLILTRLSKNTVAFKNNGSKELLQLVLYIDPKLARTIKVYKYN